MLDKIRALHYEAKGILLILLTGIAVYYHTLDVPFYLDDIASIVDNPAIMTLADIEAIWSFSPMRFVGYYSFALNFALHGTDLAGYHIVNITIHLLNAIVIFLILTRLQILQDTGHIVPKRKLISFLPLTVAIIFVVHPLNTQAVTYIVQRLASMSALFYLTTILFYITARSLSQGIRQMAFLMLAIAFMSLALLTKQNTVTLPISILLIELCFFTNSLKDIKRLSVYFFSMVGLTLTVAVFLIALGYTSLESIDLSLRETELISRSDYFSSQIFVVWKYIGLMFWPHPLNLDYDSSILMSNFTSVTLLALLGHVVVILFALYKMREMRLFAFGILFYYLTLSVESSLIPIKDLMFEHRTYLPNFGLILAVVSVFFSSNKLPKPLFSAIVLSVVIVLGTLTWQRNNLWRDPSRFYDAAVKHNPGQARNWVALSQVYFKQHEDKNALHILQKELHANRLANNGVLKEPLYVIAFWSQLLRVNGFDQKADQVELHYGLSKDGKTNQRMLLEQGNSELVKARYKEATLFYNQVLSLNPKHENAQINLGVVAMMQGDLDNAEVIFSRFPDNSVSRSNLPLIASLRKGKVIIDVIERKVFEKAQ